MGAREDQPALTFIARDQRPAFGLEVGWDDVTEAVGQDVVCFIVDVLPAVGTGLRDRERFRAGRAERATGENQTDTERPGQPPGVRERRSDRRGTERARGDREADTTREADRFEGRNGVIERESETDK